MTMAPLRSATSTPAHRTRPSSVVVAMCVNQLKMESPSKVGKLRAASSHALGPDRSDVAVYVLNMGQPVKIVDLAERMIRLSGLEPGRDIDITFTGIRPGERLHEILFAREEPTAPIGIEGIVAAKPVSPPLEAMRGWLAALEQGLSREDRSVIFGVLHDAVPDFRGEAA